MNRNILISIAIVGATAVIGVLQANRLSNVSKERVVLEAEATSLGIVLDESASSKSDGRVAKRVGAKSPVGAAGSPDPKAEAEIFAKELIEFARWMEKIEKNGHKQSREDKATLRVFLDRFLALDVELFPFLVDEIRTYEGLEEQAKLDLLKVAMRWMGESDPEKTLELFLSCGDLLGDGSPSTNGTATGALHGWAGKDPVAALIWLEGHAGELPDQPAISYIRSYAIAQAFAVDPDFALDRALELERGQVLGHVSEHLAKVGKTPEDRLGILRQLRDRLGALPADPSEIDQKFGLTAGVDQMLRATLLSGVGSSLANQSFEASREFLESANLEPTESYMVAVGVVMVSERGLKDPGSWLPWLNENIAQDGRDEFFSHVVSSWTQRDHRASAEWILEQPQGALRERATYGFAQAVSGTEPESAAEWALTLPASDRRTELLQKIHQNWQARDADAAAAFARQNGLEVD